MANDILKGLKVAILVTDGFEQVELVEPRKALDEAGAETSIVSPKSGRVRGWKFTDWGDELPVDLSLDQAKPQDFDALLLPGGVINPVCGKERARHIPALCSHRLSLTSHFSFIADHRLRVCCCSCNRHDVTSMVAACSERAELRYVPMGSYGRGKVHELGKAIWSGLIDALPDLHVAVQSMFGGASNIAAEVMIGGTQRKDLVYGQVRIRSQGKHYELPHAFLLRIDESGLIKEVAAYWDNASFYSQLGKQHWTEGSS